MTVRTGMPIDEAIGQSAEVVSRPPGNSLADVVRNDVLCDIPHTMIDTLAPASLSVGQSLQSVLGRETPEIVGRQNSPLMQTMMASLDVQDPSAQPGFRPDGPGGMK